MATATVERSLPTPPPPITITLTLSLDEAHLLRDLLVSYEYTRLSGGIFAALYRIPELQQSPVVYRKQVGWVYDEHA
jgi:hypothetical protein